MITDKTVWLALMIGNSRCHWAKFVGFTLQETWNTESATQEQGRGRMAESGREDDDYPMMVASVVPAETSRWQNYPNVRMITLDDVRLQGMYPTLGIDRALATLGAGIHLGWPVLVIDAGTALTLTAANHHHQLIGGAIFPGLQLQFSVLSQKTAALPPVNLPPEMPQRWALDTPSAIQSGILYTTLAGIHNFIEAWLQEFPGGKIALTGGDATILHTYLNAQFPQMGHQVILASHLIFWGIAAVAKDRFQSL